MAANLNDGDLEMIKTAIMNMIIDWKKRTPHDGLRTEQLASWQKLLDKIDDL